MENSSSLSGEKDLEMRYVPAIVYTFPRRLLAPKAKTQVHFSRSNQQALPLVRSSRNRQLSPADPRMVTDRISLQNDLQDTYLAGEDAGGVDATNINSEITSDSSSSKLVTSDPRPVTLRYLSEGGRSHCIVLFFILVALVVLLKTPWTDRSST